MTKPKLIASHYTNAQIARLLNVTYNRLRAILVRVPGVQETIVGTKMIAASHLPALRAAKAQIDREKK